MKKILVVDDEPLNLKLAVYMLSTAGYEVLGASSGTQAVEMASAQLPDLVLMDIQMPGMDGIATLHQLRGDPHTAALKVAAFTGLTKSGSSERLHAHGFDGFLGKPIRRREFLQDVAELLGESPE